MKHWAADLTGRPWSQTGEGPDSFSCWGLVRYAFHVKHGVDLPMIADDQEPSNLRDVMQAARAAGWSMVASRVPHPDDVVLMRNSIRLHVGLIVASAGGVIGVLHSTHEKGVILEDFRTATAGMSIELWRRREQC